MLASVDSPPKFEVPREIRKMECRYDCASKRRNPHQSHPVLSFVGPPHHARHMCTASLLVRTSTVQLQGKDQSGMNSRYYGLPGLDSVSWHISQYLLPVGTLARLRPGQQEYGIVLDKLPELELVSQQRSNTA